MKTLSPFVESENILSVIGLAEMYNCRPSSFFKEEIDEYTAYCLDEACAYMANRMKDGEKPSFKRVKGQYKNFSDYYKDLGV